MKLAFSFLHQFRLPHAACALAWAGSLLLAPSASAQIIEVSSFDPTEVGSLCGLGFDESLGTIWVYECSDANLYSYATDGTFLGSVPRPGESANDVDIEIAPEALILGTTNVPAGSILFINGESGVAEIYAIDPGTGMVLGSLTTAFGVSHVVGGAYDTLRNTFFLVQDKVPGTTDENLIAEIDPVTGAVLQVFQITSTFSVNFGDIEVSTSTGNLFVVSSDETRLAEYTSSGTLLGYHDLPAGVTDLSGIGHDCADKTAWVCGTSGTIWELGEVPCRVGITYCSANANSTGAPAELNAFGSASSAAGDLTLHSAPVPNQSGIFFHGATQIQQPFGNGFLCASGGIVRGAVVFASGNSASYTYDNSNSAHSLSAYVGATRHFQHWYRDPMAGGAAFNTSFATSIAIAP